MKVSFNNSYRPSFGYDKKLNKELVEKLKSYPDKDWAKTLTSMNRVCNNLEKNLTKSEKISSSESKFQEYLDLFLTQKQMLAGFIAITFEDLFFADKEFDHYQDEFIKRGAKQDDWRIDVCNYLDEWCELNHSKVQNNETQPTQVIYVNPDEDEIDYETDENTSFITTNGPAPSERQLNSTDGSNLRKNSLLEEFIPKSSSPKGFSDVAGMEKVKKDLENSIVKMINNPEQAQQDFEEYGKEMPRAILLYGPPGCGKTYISEALSAEINTPLYMFSIGKAGSSYVNATSKNIKSAFDEAISIANKTKKPVLVFMDEIDSIGFDRNDKTWPEDIKQVATLLQSMDKAEDSGVIILAATNKYQLLDPAVKRRFTTKTFVDVPDDKARIALLKHRLSSVKKGQNLAENQDSLSKISKQLDGFSNDSICKITYNASMNALERDRAEIDIQDFEKAIEETTEEKPDRIDYSEKNRPKEIKGFKL